MWKVKTFIDLGWNPDWFHHRFSGTAIVDQDGKPWEIRNCTATYILVRDYENHDQMEIALKLAKDWEVGTPVHGWVLTGEGEEAALEYYSLLPRNRWKWGWKPFEDTDGPNPWHLLKPVNVDLNHFLDTTKYESVLGTKYARIGRDVYYCRDKIGYLDRGEIIVDPEAEFVLYDTTLDIPKRLAA